MIPFDMYYEIILCAAGKPVVGGRWSVVGGRWSVVGGKFRELRVEATKCLYGLNFSASKVYSKWFICNFLWALLISWAFNAL